MENIVQILEPFADRLKHVESVLKEANKEVLNYEEEIFFCLGNCERNLTNLLTSKNINDHSDFTNYVRKIISEWGKAINKWEKNTKESSKVREDLSKFGSGLIVAVFGRTDSGKSTLGNFIKGKTLRETEFDNPWKHEDFVASDIEVIESKNNETLKSTRDWFKEGDTETTKEIQLFTLPGLTWVDTPGFGSLNKELEKLAQKYVSRADIIVYLDLSDNPGLKSVTEKVVPYMKKTHNKVLLVINHSDMMSDIVKDPLTGDFLFDENGNPIRHRVPKTAEVRSIQEQQLLSALNDLGYKGESDAVSISLHLANKALETNDTDLFHGANIEAFFSKIEYLIDSDKKIKKLKFSEGRQSLINLIDDIVEIKNIEEPSLNSFISSLANFKKNAEKVFNNFNPELLTRILSTPIISNFKNDITYKLTALLEGNDTNSLKDNELQTKLENEINIIVNRTLDSISESIKNKTSDLLKELFVVDKATISIPLPNIVIPKITKIIEEFEYEVSDYDYERRDPHGIIEHIASFFGKRYYRVEKTKKIEKKQVDLGLNTDEILNELHNTIPEQIKSSIFSALTSIKEDGANFTIGLLDEISAELNKTKSELLCLSKKLKAEIEEQ